jgi:hypothetical protein
MVCLCSLTCLRPTLLIICHFFLLPEILILSAAVLALLIYVRARSFYTNERFFNELASVFGKEAVNALTVGSYEYSVLLRFHNSKRRLTALFQAW